MRRLAATGVIALLGCRVGAELELGREPTPPQVQDRTTSEAGEPAPRPWPEPEREPTDFPRGVAIVDVVQYEHVQSPPEQWTLDPQGHWLAEPKADGCDLWDIESGLRLGRWSDAQLDPCTQWPKPELALGYGIEPSSYDGALTASIVKGDVELLAGDAVVRTLACRGCAEVRELAWEPRGHRLALVREGGGVELWDGDTGERRAILSKRAQLGKRERIHAIRLAWSALGVLVSYDVKRPNGKTKSEYDYESDFFDWHTQIELWNDAGTDVQAFRSDDHLVMDYAFTDATRQWLFVIHDDPNRAYEVGQQLAVYPLAGRHSALAWKDWDDSVPQRIDYESRRGRWRVDAATTWLADYTEETLPSETWAFGLAVLHVEPTPSFERIELLRDDEAALEHEKAALRPFAHVSGKPVIDWWYLDGSGVRIEHQALDPAIAGCTLVDVSPDLGAELLRCGSELRVRGHGRIHALGLPPESRWIWGRSGWLAVEHGGRLLVLDAALQVLVDQRDTALLDAALANTHDLLALKREHDLSSRHSVAEFELLNPLTDSVVLRVEQPVDDAALSPDGKRIATLGQQKVRIFAVEEGTLLARWDEPAAQQLAFAQDGRLLFTGVDRPERAWNSYTGELAPEGVVALPDGTRDPSWRWSISGHDRVVRTLDGLALTLGPSWAMLDDGRFVGTPPIERTRERRYRVGDALTVPSCSFTDLERWLQRPQLLEDFFAGRPIAPAVMPDDEAARTQCSASPKP